MIFSSDLDQFSAHASELQNENEQVVLESEDETIQGFNQAIIMDSPPELTQKSSCFEITEKDSSAEDQD